MIGEIKYTDIDRDYVSTETKTTHKSVIKLDKNFHLYIHGSHELIEQGEDEKGKFIKVRYEKMD